MKKYIEQLSHYNLWATETLIGFIQAAGPDKMDIELVSSFPSIGKTALHIYGAEDIWLQRLQKQEKLTWRGAQFDGTHEELLSAWKNASLGLQTFAKNISEEQLAESITFKNTLGEQYTHTYQQAITHVFNHSTFHRGQLVTLLRQVGFTQISSTDLITYYRLHS